MKVSKAEVVAANELYFSDWAPGVSADSRRVEADNRITVFRDKVDLPYVKVTFKTDVLWAIRDNTPDAKVILDWLSGVASGGVESIVINGVTALLDTLQSGTELIDKITETQERPFYATFVVPGEVSQASEQITATCSVQGNLLTTDGGDTEHACIPLASFEFNGGDKAYDREFNVGKKGIKPIRFTKLNKTKQIPVGAVYTQLDLESILKTNGRGAGATVSAAFIRKVEFTFSRAVEVSNQGPPNGDDSSSGTSGDNSETESGGSSSGTGSSPTGSESAGAGGVGFGIGGLQDRIIKERKLALGMEVASAKRLIEIAAEVASAHALDEGEKLHLS